MGAYKRDVVVITKMGAYIHGVHIFYGCLLSRFYGISHVFTSQRRVKIQHTSEMTILSSFTKGL